MIILGIWILKHHFDPMHDEPVVFIYNPQEEVANQIRKEVELYCSDLSIIVTHGKDWKPVTSLDNKVVLIDEVDEYLSDIIRWN